MTIYFRPPTSHPRAGEKVKLKKPDGRLIDAEIHWVYGQDKYFLVSVKDKKYEEGLTFEVTSVKNIEFITDT